VKSSKLGVAICIIFVFCSGISHSIPKFDKWSIPGYFRGFNTSIWSNVFDTELTASDLIDLKASGANIAIIQTQGLVEHMPPYSPIDPWVVDGLDSMVSYCRNAGLYYVICPRSGPGRRDVWREGEGLDPPSTIWTNESEQQLYAKMLKDIVIRFLSDTLFIGLDLIQEPNPFDDAAACLPVAELEAVMADSGIDVNYIYSICIDSVRTIDSDLPLLVQTVHWSDPGYFTLCELQDDDKIVYNTHCYNPYDYSHCEDAMTETYPGNFWYCAGDYEPYWNRTLFNETVFTPVRTFQSTHGVPIILGEFGMQYAQNGGEQYLEDIAGVACDFGWHFVLWSYRTDSTFNYELMGGGYWSTVCTLLTCIPSEIEDKTEKVPVTIDLNVYPNPFNSSCVISVSGEWSAVGDDNRQPPTANRIEIYDLRGTLQLRSVPSDNRSLSGGCRAESRQVETNNNHTFIWRPDESISSGIYLIRVKKDEQIIQKRVVYLK